MPKRERSIRTEGLVLRRKDFGEADRILTLFTRKLGKLSGIAKGSRKPHSKMSGHLEVFNRASFLISRGRNLQIIVQAETLDSYPKLRENLSGIGSGSYIVELIDAFTFEEGSQIKLYDLLITTLEALDRGEDPAVITHYYELHLLDLIGFRPELFACVECGQEIIEENQYLSGELGGVVCPDCLNQVSRGAIRPVSARILKYMRHFQRSSLQNVLKLSLPDEVRAGLESTIQYYLTHTLEGQLNSPAFMKRVGGDSN